MLGVCCRTRHLLHTGQLLHTRPGHDEQDDPIKMYQLCYRGLSKSYFLYIVRFYW